MSTSVAIFNDNDIDNGQEKKGAKPLTGEALGVAAAAEGEWEGAINVSEVPENSEADIGAATETEAQTAQEWLGKLATAVVQELRKGIDAGSIAAARAQAIRR